MSAIGIISKSTLRVRHLWRGGRVVYGSGLENQRGRKLTVGSNPTLSAIEHNKPSLRLGFLLQSNYPSTNIKQRNLERIPLSEWRQRNQIQAWDQ